MKIAVILFPGVNCENESVYACQKVGMKAEVYRWNCGIPLSNYEGFVLAGGWAYEDRVRAGAIAAKDPLIEELKVEANKGKPVIGICNGAQVLVESGMVPNTEGDFKVDFALAKNINPKVSGYYCTWTNLVNSAGKPCAFTTTMKYDEIIKAPIAHGEGRFVTTDTKLIEKLLANNQIVLQYCDEKGDIINEFPTNPNGSTMNIAAICNPQGNVMAIMPHPERAIEARQVPGFKGDYKQARSNGPGAAIFESMKNYIEGRK